MDPKELLLKHFEKVVALVFVGFFAWLAAAPMASRPKDLDENTKLQDTISKIDVYMKTYSPKLDAPTDLLTDLRRQCDPALVAPVEPFPAWVAHKRPSFAFGVQAGPAKVYPKHEPPTDFRVSDKGRGRVVLSWKTSAENDLVNITGYTIWRKDGDAGEFKVVADNLPGDKTEYTDTSVASRSKYWYRLCEHAAVQAENPLIVRDKTDLAGEKKDLNAPDLAEPVETPQDVYVTIDGGKPADPIAEPPLKGEIQCKVWRWHAASGKFLYKGYLKVTEGEKIGKEEKISMGKATEKVDFSTDAELVEVRREKRQAKTGGTREVIVAKVRWPWKQEEDLVEKELPEEIRAQVNPGKGK